MGDRAERQSKNLGGEIARVDAELYDVRNDLGETREVAKEHPKVVERLLTLAQKAREELGDRGRQGRGQRPAGWVHEPEPRLRALGADG